MNRVYLEPQVMATPTGARVEPETSSPMPAAVEALGHLAGAYELVVLGDSPGVMLELEGLEVPLHRAAGIAEPAHGSWLITDDPDSCATRAPGLRTILVGPRRAPTNRPMPRCDVEARDLSAAVVEILTREAMAR